MKVMNEIVSEYEGEIAGVLVKSGEVVEYGQPIILLKR
jgi:acetyl-CoA carboxylase biotin carboxyl carrier protein